jgi:hypothetical protein
MGLGFYAKGGVGGGADVSAGLELGLTTSLEGTSLESCAGGSGIGLCISGGLDRGRATISGGSAIIELASPKWLLASRTTTVTHTRVVTVADMVSAVTTAAANLSNGTRRFVQEAIDFHNAVHGLP